MALEVIPFPKHQAWRPTTMPTPSSFKEALLQQPWRSGVGLPKNMLDPTWNGEPRDTCLGVIQWEGTSTWWFCSTCGYVSHGGYTVHKPTMYPSQFWRDSVLFFLSKKLTEGLSYEDITNQMLYVGGVAIRQAAVTPPEKMEQYLKHITTRP